MDTRRLSLADRVIGEIDRAIKVLAAPARAARQFPATSTGEFVLDETDRLEAARLMRVNHSGEIAAQALYQGQAATAREPVVAASMRHSATEEMDHLAWCERRIEELGGRTSVLNPLWYAASFAIGAAAGAAGDRVSLGFIGETEKQVEAHLRDHQSRLPAADERSRAVLSQMTHDEIRHGKAALELGGEPLPGWVRIGMRITSRVMTHVSYWL